MNTAIIIYLVGALVFFVYGIYYFHSEHEEIEVEYAFIGALGVAVIWPFAIISGIFDYITSTKN